MEGYIEKFIVNNRIGEMVYVIFRIVVALDFMQHGFPKVFGIFGGPMAPIWSLIWFAGIIELLAGLFITLGLFTRLFAFISAIEMAYAYSLVHARHGFFPIQNQGELALLFFVCFLMITVLGAGRFSLEKYILGREIF